MAPRTLDEELQNSLTLAPPAGESAWQRPAARDVSNARQALMQLPPPVRAKLKFMVAGDGDVGYFLENGAYTLEIGFNDGTISFYGTAPGGLEVKGDFPFVEKIPSKLQAFAEKIAPKQEINFR